MGVRSLIGFNVSREKRIAWAAGLDAALMQ